MYRQRRGDLLPWIHYGQLVADCFCFFCLFGMLHRMHNMQRAGNVGLWLSAIFSCIACLSFELW